jgi:putative heme-binding domain-containing protein
VRLIARTSNPTLQRSLLRGMHEALAGRRRVAMPEGWPEVARRLQESPDAEVRQRARSLSLIFGDPAAVKATRAVVIDSTAKPQERAEALKDLVQMGNPELVPLLHELVRQGDLRGPALRGLAAFDHPDTPAVVLESYRQLDGDERQDAIATLAARPACAVALLEAVAKGTVDRRDLTVNTVRQLLRFEDQRINELLNRTWGSVRPTPEDKAAQVARYKALLSAMDLKKADLGQGRLVFHRNCASCHVLFDAGRKLGPELTGSQRHNLDYVLANLIDPNAVVGRDFQMTVLQTVDGRLINGIVRQEDQNAVTIQTANDMLIVPKDEIEVRKQTAVSMMPEGLLAKLPEHEIRDLVAYLASPTQVPLPEEQ